MSGRLWRMTRWLLGLPVKTVEADRRIKLVAQWLDEENPGAQSAADTEERLARIRAEALRRLGDNHVQ